MTHDGVKRLMMIMTAAYPNYHPVDMSRTITVWESLLQQYDDAEGARAMQAYILSDTKGFPPAIGQIVDLIHHDPDELGGLEAWGMVDRALRNSNYGAEEEFAKLPDTIKEALGGPGQLREWAAMDSKTVQSVGQSNFLNAYRVAAQRASQARKMPPEARALFERSTAYPAIVAREEEPERVEGIPMPEETRRRLATLFGRESE